MGLNIEGLREPRRELLRRLLKLLKLHRLKPLPLIHQGVVLDLVISWTREFSINLPKVRWVQILLAALFLHSRRVEPPSC